MKKPTTFLFRAINKIDITLYTFKVYSPFRSLGSFAVFEKKDVEVWLHGNVVSSFRLVSV
jgi:hypothetical protein